MWVLPTVTASIMIARFNCGRKVRCHMVVVEINWVWLLGRQRRSVDECSIARLWLRARDCGPIRLGRGTAEDGCPHMSRLFDQKP